MFFIYTDYQEFTTLYDIYIKRFSFKHNKKKLRLRSSKRSLKEDFI